MDERLAPFVASALLLLALAALFLLRGPGRATFVLPAALAVVVLMGNRVTELVVSFKEVKVRLDRIEAGLQDVASAMETLVVAQQVQALEDGNVIVLDYDPVPQSIRIVCGPLTHFPRPEYGYRLDGRRIVIETEHTEPG